jgi:hypothetical protein
MFHCGKGNMNFYSCRTKEKSHKSMHLSNTSVETLGGCIVYRILTPSLWVTVCKGRGTPLSNVSSAQLADALPPCQDVSRSLSSGQSWKVSVFHLMSTASGLLPHWCWWNNRFWCWVSLDTRHIPEDFNLLGQSWDIVIRKQGTSSFTRNGLLCANLLHCLSMV